MEVDGPRSVGLVYLRADPRFLDPMRREGLSTRFEPERMAVRFRHSGLRCGNVKGPTDMEGETDLERFKNWRRGPGSNRRIKVLQTSPLPLGYRALE